ncbi:hypothetical protein EJ05DRAFT_378785 [Pseudovirgaria hyperparasitica]|uniref:F-box domain-containing protein n=1 Tax=Pseudovirgaria hyperparasitica TaxID=470096 RepID=A0A6A6W7F0_9PEZI|nr:uncharacterized protein EJ05DRAFT_378785 [Pseudovirgaria hyperparasitica]KAF2758139.1 hypothetical protein EJ05DRAFT_378785 [Pseudovirgaria hyperparasitica]
MDQNQTEAELESFRQRWREEVKARKTPKAEASTASTGSYKPQYEGSAKAPLPRTRDAGKQRQEHEADDDKYQPSSFHDIKPRETGLRLSESSSAAAARSTEPSSALEHYEEAVAKESIGKLGDSVSLYRKAFKLDDRVHESYKQKHFPVSSFPPKPKPAPQTASQSQTTSKKASAVKPDNLTGLSSSLVDLLSDFSSLKIEGEVPPTELSPAPPCPIADLPEELLTEILLYVAVRDVASFVRTAQVCKRLAYLVLTEERIWKRVALGHEFGMAAMHYSWACRINGEPLLADEDRLLGLSDDDQEADEELYKPEEPSPAPPLTLVPATYPTYRAMFRLRPRIRFNGVYISTVNYTRPGASSPSQVTWNTPVLIVTYFRYLRFFRDGTCISLLTLAEPSDVVHHLIPENMKQKHQGNLPQSVMKEALAGRWRLSGPDDALAKAEHAEEREAEGTLHIETDGSVPKYMFRMAFSLGSAGRGARNNKLNWQGYWSYNKTTDDWGEFGLKHDKPYYWSRVRSFGTGL